MANINLLPWREERRQELKQAFLLVLACVAAVAAALVFLGDNLVSGAIEAQAGRNSYLQRHIDELTLQVQEIEALEEKKQELEDRMTVIQRLQGNRPIIVRIFDDMVNTLPDGVFFTELTRTDDKIMVTGIAESNNRISSLMRRLDGSDWFASSNLKEVAAQPSFGEQASRFNLFFDISTPPLKVEEE